MIYCVYLMKLKHQPDINIVSNTKLADVIDDINEWYTSNCM